MSSISWKTQTNISKRLLHASSQQLKEVIDLCNCLSCTSVATVPECIHTNLMIWHLLNNLLNLFLFNRVSSPFLCKGTLVFTLLVLYKNLLPTALWLCVEMLVKRGGGQCFLYYLFSFVFFSRYTFELIMVIMFMGKQNTV